MLQSLLVERFHLAFHRETASCPGYELVVDPRGCRLMPLSPKPPGADDSQAPKSAPGTGADGFPSVPGPRMMGFRAGVAHQRIKFQELGINSVAVQLGFLIGRAQGKSVDDGSYQPRVVNKTGLEGIYTFILQYDCPACEPLTATSSNAPDGIDAPALVAKELGGFSDIFGAVQKELGLRLVRTADVPGEIIVVDQVDKIPTEN